MAATHSSISPEPKIKVAVADMGRTALAGSPADFGRLVTDDTEKWAKVIRTININTE